LSANLIVAHKGGNNYEIALSFIVKQFMLRLDEAKSRDAVPSSPKKNHPRVVSTHVITALDITSMDKIFAQVLEIIIRPFLDPQESL
jgi:hypothetical protein